MTAQLTAPLTANDIESWIAENRTKAKPPSGVVPFMTEGMLGMGIYGPNNRSDFHVQDGEEIFIQYHGTMTLRIVQDGQVHDILLPPGSFYALPAGVPHSPQRPEGSFGFVIERKVAGGRNDELLWVCEADGCMTVVHREPLKIEGMGEIPAAIGAALAKFDASEELRTCPTCGKVKPARASAET